MSTVARSRRLGVLAIVVLVLLAGCVTVTMEFTVDEDGSFDFEQEVTYGPELAELVMEDPEWEGPDALAAELAEDIATAGFVNVESAGEVRDDGSIWLHVTSTDNDAADIDEIEIDVGDDEITFTLLADPILDDDPPIPLDEDDPEDDWSDDWADDEWPDDEFANITDDIDMRYIVNMPGEIIAHNGEQVDANTVEWTLEYLIEQDDELEELTVTSGVGEVDDGDDTDDGDGIPGFGLALALVSLLAVTLFAYRYHRGR